jgi:predicted transcriptional regulator
MTGKQIVRLRKRAKLSRAGLAWLVGRCERQMKRYEDGQWPVPPEIAAMIERKCSAWFLECARSGETAK